MAAFEDRHTSMSQSAANFKVAVIIPFRDSWPMTANCIESVLKQELSTIELTLCLVDNGSKQPSTQKGIDQLKLAFESGARISSKKHLRVLRDERPFNFSQLNNSAVEFLTSTPSGLPRPDYLLFLNNDTLWENTDSLSKLVHFASLSPRFGAIGCTLLYANSKVQHLFLAPGVKLAGAHPAKGSKVEPTHAWYSDPRPVAAVTGALLLVSTEHFEAVKGFDTALATSCQDLDLCLKLQALGLENWVLPNVFVKHFETSTRLKQNQASEITYVATKWGSKLAMNSYFSHNLSRWSERPAKCWKEGEYPWAAVISARCRTQSNFQGTSNI